MKIKPIFRAQLGISSLLQVLMVRGQPDKQYCTKAHSNHNLHQLTTMHNTPDEFEIIKKYFLPLTNGNKAANMLHDDVATISVGSKKDLIVSKDLMAEGVHFNKDDGAYNIACKLLKTNLSDIAAAGGKPLYYLLGFSQNQNLDKNFVKEFCRGLKDVSKQFSLDLIGGDSIKTKDKLCFSVTIFGEIAKKKSLKRNSAKNGDLIFVSGDIGDAFLGLNLLQKNITISNKIHQKYLLERHLQPIPRVNLGMELIRQNLSQAAIDISDGFLADLLHICEASKLDAVVHQSAIPISTAAKFCLSKNDTINLNQLLSGGDDYELIFTASATNQSKIEKLAKKIGVKITCVGCFKQSKNQPKIELLDDENKLVKLDSYGWKHY